MATSSEQSNQNSGYGGTVGQGIGRDVNASIGIGDITLPNLSGAFSNFGTATSSATSGAVTVGDRILGGTKSTRQFGLVKILALVAGVAILYKLYKKKG